ncbi:hypothetical protein J3A83DRAFT_4232830 [Scleroderma citrinum]
MQSEPTEARSGYESDVSSEKSLHSDNIDEEFVHTSLGKRRRPPSPSARTKSSKAKSEDRVAPREKQGKKLRTREKKRSKTQEECEEHSSDIDLKEGQEVVGKVVQAPKTGWAPKGQISQHTLDFLNELRNPDCNDRAWFKLHGILPHQGLSKSLIGGVEPIYRQCETEFREFIQVFSEVLVGADPQIPPLPPKDVIHRIYRDIRFSNDKTPYKTGLSASFSRSGRKGIFAFCSIVKPGNESMIAAGAWCPGKNELSSIRFALLFQSIHPINESTLLFNRNHILHSSDRFREVISHPDFVANFGEPHPHPDGKRRSVFGHEDELRTAPKGVNKSHVDIDLLKCRSLAVSRTFTDEQVLSSVFTEELEKVAQVLRPFVHCLNDMITLPVGGGSTDQI